MARLGVRFSGDRSGATAVEFALVAGPLILMLFAIMELALVFIVSSTLDSATADVARTIRTGAVQKDGGGSADKIRTDICGKISWLPEATCEANLSVDVRTFSQFTDITAPDPVKKGKFDKSQLLYSPGKQGDVVLVRAFYRWKLLTPALLGGLQRLDDGSTVMTAATTFRNEPY